MRVHRVNVSNDRGVVTFQFVAVFIVGHKPFFNSRWDGDTARQKFEQRIDGSYSRQSTATDEHNDCDDVITAHTAGHFLIT